MAVKRAENWQWSSLWVRHNGTAEQKGILSDWPVKQPADWIERVNAALTPREQARWEPSLIRGQPFGDEKWTRRTVTRLGLEHTVRREGRPKKQEERRKKGK